MSRGAPASARAGRRSDRILAGWGLLLVLGVVVGVHAWSVQGAAQQRVQRSRVLAQGLDLTDMALFTEARYARHLSQADLSSALQDGPGSLEHFPAGSWVAPPSHLAPGGRVTSEGTAVPGAAGADR